MWIPNSGPMQRRFSNTSNYRKGRFSESLNSIQLRHSQKYKYKYKYKYKKTLPYKNLITPMLPLSLLFLPFSWLNFEFYFQKTSLYFALYNLNYCSRLSVIGLTSYPIGILYLAPVMLGLSTTHEAISVEKRMPLDDWRHQWFAIA